MRLRLNLGLCGVCLTTGIVDFASAATTVSVVPREKWVKERESVIVDIYLESDELIFLRAYQMVLPCSATRLYGYSASLDQGSIPPTSCTGNPGDSACRIDGVTYPCQSVWCLVHDPIACGGEPSDCIRTNVALPFGHCRDAGRCRGPGPEVDQFREDYVFYGMPPIIGQDPGRCPDSPQRIANAVFPGQSVLLVPGERKYLGQFTYRSMGYGSYGEFSIALEGVSNPPTDLDDSRMRDEAGSLIPFEPIEGIVIVYHADFFPCFWDSECYWVDSDPCTNDRCVDGDCVAVPIPDCEFISIVSADPPDGAIDARQPSEFDGGDVVGWSSFDLTFDRDPAELNRFDFEVTQEGGQGEPPTVTSVMPLGGNVLRVNLSAGIAPAAWTTITHLDSGTSVCVGYLPGDVNGDGTSGPLDVLRLIDCLNSAAVCEIRQCDVDRSGKCDARDALREVDLLNGANAYGAWNGQSLPMHFCP